jgi:hypothetical protein
MKAIIVFIFIAAFFVMFARTSARAQDISIQSSAMGNMSLLRISDIKADFISPITIKTSMNDEDFSEIVWRGLTMHYQKITEAAVTKVTALRIDRRVFNSLCQPPVFDEQKVVRQAWKDAFGFDVWYPYYKAKEVEGWVKKKATIKVFKLKGEPIIEKGRIMYSFKTRF